MKAVLIGASGATGSELLKILLSEPAVSKVIALVRRTLNIRSNKLEEHIIDFDKPQQWQNLVKGDVAFSCLGTTIKNAGSKVIQHTIDYQYQLSFAQSANQNNIPTFVLISAFSANANSNFFYPRIKGELENAISLLYFKHLLIFRPGLLSRPKTDRKTEKIVENILCLFNKLGLLLNYKPLKTADLAKFMYQHALKPSTGKTIIEADQILKEVGKGQKD